MGMVSWIGKALVTQSFDIFHISHFHETVVVPKMTQKFTKTLLNTMEYLFEFQIWCLWFLDRKTQRKYLVFLIFQILDYFVTSPVAKAELYLSTKMI